MVRLVEPAGKKHPEDTQNTVQRNVYFVVHPVRGEMEVGPFDKRRGGYPGPGVRSADNDAIAPLRQAMQAE